MTDPTRCHCGQPMTNPTEVEKLVKRVERIMLDHLDLSPGLLDELAESENLKRVANYILVALAAMEPRK